MTFEEWWVRECQGDPYTRVTDGKYIYDRQSAEDAWNAALEEAAKRCEQRGREHFEVEKRCRGDEEANDRNIAKGEARDCAAAIRALKSGGA